MANITETAAQSLLEESAHTIAKRYRIPIVTVKRQLEFCLQDSYEQFTSLQGICVNEFSRMRQLYLSSRGEYNLSISRCCSSLLRLVDNSDNSLYDWREAYDEPWHTNANSALRDGFYYTKPHYLSQQKCNDILRVATFPEFKPGASRRFAILQPLYSHILKNLVDELYELKLIASRYFGHRAILKDISLAHSVSFDPMRHHISRDALQWHFDHDNNAHVKVFVYLSDVSLNNGPHCYIGQTLKAGLPRRIVHDGRYSSSQVLEDTNYPVAITGERGLLIIGDTQNIHRGTPLKEGERYLLQFTFADSLYGRKDILHESHELHEFNRL